MQEKQTASGGGIGFAGLLTLAFIVLKLLHKIEWSWVWVLSPAWIGLALGILAFVVVLIVNIVANRS